MRKLYWRVRVFVNRVRLYVKFGEWPPREAAVMSLKRPTADDIRWATEEIQKRVGGSRG